MQVSPAIMMKLAKFAGLKTADLTTDIVVEIGGILGFDVPSNKVNEVISLIQSDDADSLAEWADRGENLDTLKSFLLSMKPSATTPALVQCPHCTDFFELHFESKQ